MFNFLKKCFLEYPFRKPTWKKFLYTRRDINAKTVYQSLSRWHKNAGIKAYINGPLIITSTMNTIFLLNLIGQFQSGCTGDDFS